MFGNFLKTIGVSGRANTLLAPLAGKVIALSDVKDQLFAKGLLGQGVAIEPSGSCVVAPADSKIEAIFPTGHAVALHTCDGLDVLIHIGLNTEQLNGRHFKVHAAVGDAVTQGDVLIEFDREAIEAEGFDPVAPILICNSVEFDSIKGRVGEQVSELDELVTVKGR